PAPVAAVPPAPSVVQAPPVVHAPPPAPPVVHAPAPAPPVAHAPPPAPPVVHAPPPPAPAPLAAAPRDVRASDAPASLEVMQVEEATLPPPPLGADEIAIDVDVGVATPPPPPPPSDEAEPEVRAPREPLASQERLSAGPPSNEPAADAGSSVEPGEVLSQDEEEEAEHEEEAPVSSRRPVAPPEERLAEIAFGSAEPQPPRHTPPPKSGRLPAPAAVEFDGDVTGVRDAVSIPSADDDVTQPLAQPGRPPSVLTGQATRPNLQPAARLPDLIGEAQAFAPATFLELLDASLSL
ncbi:MAG TPA: hypothetical protein VHV30_00980, partial [Polyangiaceae bacterium]|nr:hypothetical protein [Polyangiaceae bacterium]